MDTHVTNVSGSNDWTVFCLNLHCLKTLTLSHKQQICRRLLWDYIDNTMIWKNSLNGSVIIKKSWIHCGKRRNCSSWAISSFVTMFSKIGCCNMSNFTKKMLNCSPLAHILDAKRAIFNTPFLLNWLICIK